MIEEIEFPETPTPLIAVHQNIRGWYYGISITKETVQIYVWNGFSAVYQERRVYPRMSMKGKNESFTTN